MRLYLIAMFTEWQTLDRCHCSCSSVVASPSASVCWI